MDLLELFKTLILGIIEGITEWLPISSTGHMILVDEFIQLNQTQAFKDKAFKDMFFVVVQLGAILAVVLIYWNKIFPFNLKEKTIDMDKINLWMKIVVACVPAGVIGILFDDFMDEHLRTFLVVAIMLIVYGVLFIVVENWNKGKKPVITNINDITYRAAFIIGIWQVLSLIPGTSRSGATIVGALLLGMSRYVAAEFTFYLAIPVMFGASFVKLLKFGFVFTVPQFVILLVGMVVSFLVSIFAIKFLMGYIKKHDFKVFGYYRIILGIILIVYMLFTA